MTIDEIYSNIGQNIFNSIEDGNWTKATLNIEIVGDGVVGYSGEYEIGGDIKDISVRKISRDIRSWIRELHGITTEKGNNKWNRAVFNLTRDGKFDMDFIWDQALQDDIERLAKR
ncbi:MAG TPA: immunity protein YezG family protein [Pseudoxanthomonas sp.]